MRKFFVMVAAIIMTLVMSVSALGCNLVVVNNEKDMAQVVAVIKIEEDVPEKENTIYKKDILMSYLNYGYYYEQNGQSREDVIEFIVNNLISNRVYVQVAMLSFNENKGDFAGHVADSSKDKWDVERYLTNDELVEAAYLTKSSLDDMIHSYEDEHNHEGGASDTITETIRTIPTGATNAADKEEDPTLNEMKNFKIDTDSTASRKKAYNKVIEVLDENALLGEYKTSLEETDYYKQLLKSNQEQKLIEKYEKCVTAPVHAKYKMTDVVKLFNDEYAKQTEWSDKEYSEKLSSASATSPILFASTGTYGYVYNLLLGISDEQKAELEEYDEKNPNASQTERAKEREKILAKTTVKDLRSTWILSGYDFDGTKFTGDYTFTSAENSLKFFGETKLLNPDNDHEEEGHDHDEYVPEYGVLSTEEIKVADFVTMMEEYVYGSAQSKLAYSDPSVYKAVKTNEANDEYEERINELLFAFSTDGGSLNTYKGYTISPVPDGSNQEQYMQEFADYGRKVLDGEVGTKGYVMVATDYGYHIMFYSRAYKAGAVYSTLADYLNGECKKFLTSDYADWNAYFEAMQDNWAEFEDTDNYLYVLYNNLVSKEIEDTVKLHQQKLLNDYYFGENSKVVTYPDRYADLLN